MKAGFSPAFFVLVLLLMRFKINTVLFVCSLLSINLFGQHRTYIDSLIRITSQEANDTSKVIALNNLATAFNVEGYPNDSALEFANQALTLADKLHFVKGIASAHLNVGRYYKNKGENEKALDNFLHALNIAEKADSKIQLGDIYDVMGTFYRSSMKNTSKAIEYDKKGLIIREVIGDRYGMARSLSNLGSIHYDMDSTKTALQYFIAGLDTMRKLNSDTLRKSRRIIDERRSTEADVENNIGSAYADMLLYDSAIEYYTEALKTYQILNSEEGRAFTDANIGNIYNMKGELDQGEKYLLEALAIANKINAKDIEALAYGYLAEGASKTSNYEKAYQYQLALTNLKDSMFNEASAKQVNDMQVKYDTEKKEKENQILALTVNRQKILTYAILLGLLLVAGLAFFMYRSYLVKQKANIALEEKNQIIEEKNKDILDSINYAQNIQNAILPADEHLKEMLGDHFVLFKPKDVVSGDFYWCYAVADKVIFAVADCTGHGVPGALMSMVGNSLLNEIVVEGKVTDAAKILDMLRTNLVRTLQKKGQQAITRDGMDIVLCVWNKKTQELQYAGANNPLHLIRKEQMTEEEPKLKVQADGVIELLPDKQPIGFMEEKMDVPFTSITIKLLPGDTIYLTSDGYADQFGGGKDKKFTKKKFRDALAAFDAESMDTRKAMLDKAFEEWKGNNMQTDDVCVMGIKPV